MTVCTEPLPNVRSPISVARPWSRSAPATISAPEAEPRSTSTTTGAPASRSPWVASSSKRASAVRPSARTIIPDSRRLSATPTADSSTPPGLSRRSSTRPRSGDSGRLQRQHGGVEIAGRRVAEVRDAHVAVAARQRLRAHRAHVHLGPLEVEAQRLGLARCASARGARSSRRVRASARWSHPASLAAPQRRPPRPARRRAHARPLARASPRSAQRPRRSAVLPRRPRCRRRSSCRQCSPASRRTRPNRGTPSAGRGSRPCPRPRPARARPGRPDRRTRGARARRPRRGARAPGLRPSRCNGRGRRGRRASGRAAQQHEARADGDAGQHGKEGSDSVGHRSRAEKGLRPGYYPTRLAMT